MSDRSPISGARHGIQLLAADFESLLAGRAPGIAHSVVDAIHIAKTARDMGRFRVFGRTVESSPLREHVEVAAVPIEAGLGPGIRYVVADTAVGSLALGYIVTRWLGPTHPTLIYHHANLEDPFNMVGSQGNSFREIFLGVKTNMKWNILAVRAPFHGGSPLRYAREMQYLDRFCAMMAASVRLVASLVRVLRQGGSPRLVVAGLSLGGWVANLHRTYCGGADAYIPLLAGAALDDVFLGSTYRMLTASLSPEEAQSVRRSLNFEADFAAVGGDDTFPLLGRYDRVVRFGRQRVCYGGAEVVVLDRGHATAVLSVRELREHIWKCATGLRWNRLN